MSSDRRNRLRDDAVTRWRAANVAAVTTLTEARQTRSASSEARLHSEHDRARRAFERQRRGVDRWLTEFELGGRRVSAETGRPRILVADQRTAERVPLLETLRQDTRVQVVAEAMDGADALGLSIIEQPDVAILDEGLPVLSGTEIAEQLRVYAPDTRRVLLVDIDAPTLRLKHAIDAIVPKGVGVSALVEVVAQLAGV
jgi:CheY-like chemotaxis protein